MQFHMASCYLQEKPGILPRLSVAKVTVHGIPISKTVITKVALLLLKASELSAKMILYSSLLQDQLHLKIHSLRFL